MTEPPEPRRPEEGGGEETSQEEAERLARELIDRAQRLVDNSSVGTEGAQSLAGRASDEDVAEVLRRVHEMRSGADEEDYDDAWDDADADEIMDGLEDDALLDSIAQGMRGELGPDQLSELLSGLRDAPDAVDIPVPNTARVERGENVLPPRTQEGNTEPMTIHEDAAQVRQIQINQSAMGGISAASFAFAEGSQLNVPSESGGESLAGAVEAVRGDMAAAVGLLGTSASAQQVQGAGENAAAAVEAAQSAMAQAIELSNQAAAAVQGAQTLVESAREAVGIFYNAVGDAASQHGA